MNLVASVCLYSHDYPLILTSQTYSQQREPRPRQQHKPTPATTVFTASPLPTEHRLQPPSLTLVHQKAITVVAHRLPILAEPLHRPPTD